MSAVNAFEEPLPPFNLLLLLLKLLFLDFGLFPVLVGNLGQDSSVGLGPMVFFFFEFFVSIF